MRILITGACGYLGRHLLAGLARAGFDDLYALDRQGADVEVIAPTVRECRLLSPNWDYAAIRSVVRDWKPEAMLHLAALVRVENESEQLPELLRSNVILGCYLLQAGIDNGLRYVVNTGTFWENMYESNEYCPVDAYAASKRALHDLLCYYATAHPLRAITLKMFGIFGPADPRPNLFRALMTASTTRAPLAMTPGEQILELVYVEDAAKAYQHALQALLGMSHPGLLPTVEISSGEQLTLREVVHIFEAVAKQPVRIDWGAKPYRRREVMRRWADLDLTHQIIGWRPTFTVETGLREMVSCEERT